MITEREEKCVSGLIKREKCTCSSREQIYLLCPHMEVAQDVKSECTSDITVISHLDIPTSVMPERPFLVSFISLPKQFKTNGKTTKKKKNPCGVVTEGAPQGFPSTCPAKFNAPGQSSPEKTLETPAQLPACLPTHLELHLPTTCHCWAHFKRNIHHAELSKTRKIK